MQARLLCTMFLHLTFPCFSLDVPCSPDQLLLSVCRLFLVRGHRKHPVLMPDTVPLIHHLNRHLRNRQHCIVATSATHWIHWKQLQMLQHAFLFFHHSVIISYVLWLPLCSNGQAIIFYCCVYYYGRPME